jgi:hypothetical protein
MRTFSREHWLQAQAEWEAGDFSSEWKPYRHAAAMRGFIYPPEGSKWDSWDDDEPSQRAVLIRFIRERPHSLMASINRCSSWHQVIGEQLRESDWLAEQAVLDERSKYSDRMDHEPTIRQAAEQLGSILDRVVAGRKP